MLKMNLASVDLKQKKRIEKSGQMGGLENFGINASDATEPNSLASQQSKKRINLFKKNKTNQQVLSEPFLTP